MDIPWLPGSPRRIGDNVSQIDLVPTLLDLPGEPLPEGLHGESRSAVLRGGATLDDNDVVIEHNGIGDRYLTSQAVTEHGLTSEQARILNLMGTLPWRCIVTSDLWKLNLRAGDQCELFDLGSDPYELTNLFDDSAHRDRIRHMAARVRLWQHRTGDKAPLPDVYHDKDGKAPSVRLTDSHIGRGPASGRQAAAANMTGGGTVGAEPFSSGRRL